MAIPALPFLIKFLFLKILKGAVFGVLRYFRRVFHKSKNDEHGNSLSGKSRIEQAVNKEWNRRDNVIYLILMLGNAIYGTQELIIWIWRFFAKRVYTEYCAGVPAGFEMPEQFCDRIHHLPALELFIACCKWIGMASLIYWPETHKALTILPSDDDSWLEVRWKRMVYLIRIDRKREIQYRGMMLDVDGVGGVRIVTQCGQEFEYQTNLSVG